MIEHWHDPEEIVDPETTYGSGEGERLSRVLGTDDILVDRPVYFHETGLHHMKDILKEGILYGSIGITPFWYSGFGQPGSILMSGEKKTKQNYSLNKRYQLH
jgi:hypothetical protein